MWGLNFLKNHGRGDQDILVKIEGVVHIEGVPIEGGMGGMHCFSLVMYEFCSSNALYSASLSLRMFVFLLTSFGTWDCYCFGGLFRRVIISKGCFDFYSRRFGEKDKEGAGLSLEGASNLLYTVALKTLSSKLILNVKTGKTVIFLRKITARTEKLAIKNMLKSL